MKNEKTLHVRWIRSGIGFPRSQKRMVRSLGLRRLNQVVELQDTPSIRGLAAKIPHLVEIIPAPPQVAAGVPEFAIRAAQAEGMEIKAKRSRKTRQAAGEQEKSEE